MELSNVFCIIIVGNSVKIRDVWFKNKRFVFSKWYLYIGRLCARVKRPVAMGIILEEIYFCLPRPVHVEAIVELAFYLSSFECGRRTVCTRFCRSEW